MLSHAEYVTAKDRVADGLLALPGVRFVGIGGRERAGRPVPEAVIKVFVERKRAAGELPAGEVIPPEFDGIATDVVDLGATPADDPTPADPDKWMGSVYQTTVTLDESKPTVQVGKDSVKVLMAGAMVTSDAAETTTGGVSSGTIGCFLRDTTDPSTVYLVSNHHVLGQSVGNDNATKDKTKVRHPKGPDSILCSCCSNRVGRFSYGARNGVVDAAAAKLDAGTKWTADVRGIGPITGVHPFTVQQLAVADRFDVRKWGARTQGTGGVVHAINARGETFRKGDGLFYNNLVLIKANPRPGVADYCFSQEGDSGSVIVDLAGKAVAMLVAGVADEDELTKILPVPKDPGDPNHLGWTMAIPMTDVLDYFTTTLHLPVQLATATTAGQINVVPKPPKSAAIAAELAPALSDSATPVDETSVKRWLPGVTPPDTETLARLRADLEASMAGRRLLALWAEHGAELSALLDGNRRVAVAWHRSGGAGLLQLLIRMVNDPGLSIPATLNGLPLADCLDQIVDGFGRFAGPDLRSALARARSALPDLAGLTYPQALAALVTPQEAAGAHQ